MEEVAGESMQRNSTEQAADAESATALLRETVVQGVGGHRAQDLVAGDKRESAEDRSAFGHAPVTLGQIAFTFLYIGLASFSLTALGEAQQQLTKKRRWFTDEEYLQGLGLAQLMPGAPTVNLSSYLGFRLAGLPGAAIASLSFLAPCFCSMVALAYLYLEHGKMPVIANLFHGLAALVVGLVFNTILNLWEKGVKTAFNWVMALAGFAFVYWFSMGVIRILFIAAAASITAALLTRRFPALGRWTDERTGRAASGTQPRSGAQKKADALSAPEHGVSACSLMPLRLGRRQTAIQVAWLLLILALDVFLIHFRPELMQMGTRFLRIGAVVFGSGYAMLPFIQDAVVRQSHWLTNEQFAVALALSLVTPGPVTNIGVFIGYKVGGVVGALAGMANMYFPAWAMTTMVAGPYARAGKITWVKQITQGIVAAFIGTLAVVLIKLGSDTLVSIPAVLLAAGAFVAQRYTKVATLWIVTAGALVSLILGCFSTMH
jgi:chromate transporter